MNIFCTAISFFLFNPCNFGKLCGLYSLLIHLKFLLAYSSIFLRFFRRVRINKRVNSRIDTKIRNHSDPLWTFFVLHFFLIHANFGKLFGNHSLLIYVNFLLAYSSIKAQVINRVANKTGSFFFLTRRLKFYLTWVWAKVQHKLYFTLRQVRNKVVVIFTLSKFRKTFMSQDKGSTETGCYLGNT